MASQRSNIQVDDCTMTENKPINGGSSDLRTTATTVKIEFIPEAKDGTSDTGKQSNFSNVTVITECPAREKEFMPEAEHETNDTGKKGNFSNITECPSKEIKIEKVDVGLVDDTSADKCVMHDVIISNLAENDVKLFKGVEIEENVDESIEANQKEVTQSSVDNCTTFVSCENSLTESHVKTSKKGDIEGNIQEEVAKTSVDSSASIRNHENSLVENDVKLHKEEDIEDHIEEEITAADTQADIEETQEKVEKDIENDAAESIEKNIGEAKKTVAQTSVGNCATIENREDNVVEVDVKLHKEEYIEDYVEEGIEKNIERDRGKVAQTSVGNCTTTGNQEASFIEDNVTLHKEEDIEDHLEEETTEADTQADIEEIQEKVEKDVENDAAESIEKNIGEVKKTVAQTSVGNCATIENREDNVVEVDVKLHEEENIEDHTEEGIEKNIKENSEKVAQISVGNCATTGNHEDSFIKDNVKLHKEEDIEDYVEEEIEKNIEKENENSAQISVGNDATIRNQVSIELKKNSIQSAAITEQAVENYENDFGSKGGVLSADYVSVKEGNNSVSYYIDESQQSRIYYDSSRIKLVNVSVVVEDLFLEISRHDPQRHLQKHINSKFCACIFCTRKFKPENKRNFLEVNACNSATKPSHRIEEHLSEPGSEKWKLCTVCPARFRFMFNLRRHSAMNHRVYLCAECPSKFQLESDLRNHLKTHPVNEPYPCAFCSFKGRVEAELEIHARTHSSEKCFSCAQCLVEFAESYSLLDHIQKHSSSEATAKFKNKIIAKKYSAFCLNKEPYSIDSLSKVKETSPFSACSKKQSPSRTPSLTKLNQTSHLQSNLTANANVQSFSCDYSSNKFATRFPVEHHSSTLTSESLLSDVQNVKLNPEFCAFSLYTKKSEPQNVSTDFSEVNANQNVTESSRLGESTNKKWNSCTLCPARFRFMFNLTRHCAVNHHIYVCSECPVQFQLESDLQLHSKMHLANESYFCAFCSFQGRVEAELEIHARNHSTEKLFSCAECLIEFDKSYIMLDHIQEHLNPESIAKFQNQPLVGERSVIHLNGEPISNEKVDVRPKDNASSDEGVPHCTDINRCVESDTTPNKKVDIAEEKVAQVSVDSHSAISFENQTDCEFEEKSLQSVTKSQGTCLKHKNELGSEGSVFSLHTDAAVLKPSDSSDVSYLDQQQRRTCFNSSRAKFTDVSVVLEDLFLKIPRDDSLKITQRHSNSALCSCVFCTGKFKLQNEIVEFMKTEVNQDTTKSNLSAKEYVIKSANKWNSCTLCPARFRFMHHLRSHFAMSHHLYLCPECPRKFHLKSNLKTHLKWHPVEKLYFCALCSFKCKAEVELKMHARSHSVEKLFSCADCLVEFDKNDSLTDHLLRHASTATTVKFKNKTDLISRKQPPLPPIKKPGLNDNVSKDKLKSRSAPHPNKQPTSHTSCLFKLNQIPHPKSNLKTKAQSFVHNFSLAEPTTSSAVECHSPTQWPPSSVQNFGVFKLDQVPQLNSNSSTMASTQSSAFSNVSAESTSSPAKSHSQTCLSSDVQNFGMLKLDQIPHVKSHSTKNASAQPFVSHYSSAEATTSSLVERHSLTHLNECLAADGRSVGTFKLDQMSHVESNSTTKTCVQLLMCNVSPAESMASSLVERHSPSHDSECPSSDAQDFSTVEKTSKNRSQLPVYLKQRPAQQASTSATTREIKSHLAVHLNEKQYSCATCSAAFKYKGNLKQHIKRIHSDERPFACSDCPTTFKSKTEVKSHSAVHSNERPFYCQHCVAKFKNKHHLQRHLAVHSSERPCSCATCGAAFKTTSDLTRHLTTHSTERPFTCPHCTATFKTKSHLRMHSEVHSNEKPFSCIKCSATFVTKLKLQRHSVAHLLEQPFSCSRCSAAFKLKSRLRRHLEVHVTEKLFSCAICAATFKNKRGVATHLAVHATDKLFRCPQCTATFNTKNKLRLHSAVHLTERPFSCANCAATFKSKKEVRAHLSVHSKEKPFSCQLCHSSFKKRVRLNWHLKIIHSNERPFQCQICPAKFKSKNEVQIHLAVHSTERPFPCLHCVATFKTKTHLKQHSLTHAKGKPFTCTNCDATFKTERSLKSHSSVHSSERQFACQHCKFTFKTKQSLNQHLFVHTDVRPFACPHCVATFKAKKNLSQHLGTHSQKRISCDRCFALFKSKRSLWSHLITHSNEKPFICELCDARFKSKLLLKSHATVHSNARPFLCVHCSAAFKTNGGLRYHLTAHLSEKRYTCADCSATFKSKSLLKSHVRVHSNAKPFSCRECVATFKTKAGFKLHSVVHSDERPFVCTKCAAAFKTKSSLNEHLTCHSEDGQYSCAHCFARFKSKRGLRFHSAVHLNA